MASTSSGIPDLSLLIQDLLSNSLLPSTTPALISYHLSTAPPASLTRLADVLATSYALWNRAINKPYSTLDWKPATEIFEAVRNGIVYRASQLSTTTGTGYLGRRAFSQALDGLYQGIVSQDDAVNPFIRLLLTSGILAGVQAIKARRDKLYVGSRSILGNAEQQVLDSWSTIEQQKVLKASYSSSWSGQVTDKVIQRQLSRPHSVLRIPADMIEDRRFAPLVLLACSAGVSGILGRQACDRSSQLPTQSSVVRILVLVCEWRLVRWSFVRLVR